jgi:predicted phosphodiesterase
MLMDGYDLVEKEVIADFHFPAVEVLTREADTQEREKALKMAISLGNLEHQKVRIYFADDQGQKVVETTIWGITDQAIILKKNVRIPINRVSKLEI